LLTPSWSDLFPLTISSSYADHIRYGCKLSLRGERSVRILLSFSPYRAIFNTQKPKKIQQWSSWLQREFG
jgi:hypothetical protein